MRLAISNIAWPAGADEAALAVLREQGATGVELALTKIWPQPLEASALEVDRYRAWWESRGLRIVALQALLFGRPELAIFESAAARQPTLDYLRRIIALAGRLGARILVFGSPANRLRRSLSHADALEIAVPFFRQLAEAAGGHGAVFCIEPNPEAYGCDWVTDVAQGIEVVDAVNHAGFGLHLDAAAMTLAGDCAEALSAAGPRCRHFHVSAPFLHEVPGGDVPHAALARTLAQVQFRGWVSIEMSENKLQPSWQQAVRHALAFVRGTYAAGGDRDVTAGQHAA
jgi:sugar phosphate isomerase/epimerase